MLPFIKVLVVALINHFGYHHHFLKKKTKRKQLDTTYLNQFSESYPDLLH